MVRDFKTAPEPAMLVRLTALAAIGALTPWGARAEESMVPPGSTLLDAAPLTLDRPVFPLPLTEDGSVILSGSLTRALDNSVLDAAFETGGSGSRRAGLVDFAAGGLSLERQDPQRHTYLLVAEGPPSRLCTELLAGERCLVLRTAALAADRLLDVDEYREGLEGEIVVGVYAPAPRTVLSPPPGSVGPSFVDAPPQLMSHEALVAFGTAGGAASGLAALTFAVIALKRRRRPVARVRAAAARVRRRLADDPVRKRLVTTVTDLEAEAMTLAESEKRLRKAVSAAGLPKLERKSARLRQMASDLGRRGGAEAGQREMDEAVRIVQQQIDRCRKWELQRWRSAARVERIATRLESLLAELGGPDAVRSEGSDRLLEQLQEELDLARAGEAEAGEVLSETEGSKSGERPSRGSGRGDEPPDPGPAAA